MGRHRTDESSTERELILALLEEQQLNRELMNLVLMELRLITKLLDLGPEKDRFKAPVSATITVT